MVERWEVPIPVIPAKQKPMSNHHEKRNFSRHNVDGPITLHPTIRTSRDINAHLLNFSEQGICNYGKHGKGFAKGRQNQPTLLVGGADQRGDGAVGGR